MEIGTPVVSGYSPAMPGCATSAPGPPGSDALFWLALVQSLSMPAPVPADSSPATCFARSCLPHAQSSWPEPAVKDELEGGASSAKPMSDEKAHRMEVGDGTAAGWLMALAVGAVQGLWRPADTGPESASDLAGELAAADRAGETTPVAVTPGLSVGPGQPLQAALSKIAPAGSGADVEPLITGGEAPGEALPGFSAPGLHSALTGKPGQSDAQIPEVAKLQVSQSLPATGPGETVAQPSYEDRLFRTDAAVEGQRLAGPGGDVSSAWAGLSVAPVSAAGGPETEANASKWEAPAGQMVAGMEEFAGVVKAGNQVFLSSETAAERLQIFDAGLEDTIPEAARRHLVERLSLAVQRGERQYSFELYPEALGRVQALLSFAGDRLALSLTLDNAQAQQVVQQALPELRAALELHGMAVGDLEVDLAGTGLGGGFASGQPHTYPHARPELSTSSVRQETGTEAAGLLAAAGPRKSSALLDLLA